MNSQDNSIEKEVDACYCKLGADKLLKVLGTFEKQIDGVIESDDIEYIHRMRVSSRRIRAIMPLFSACFPEKKFKRWLKEIKKITRLLGEARDLDVQIQFIKNYQLNNPSSQVQIIDFLIKNLQSKRTCCQKNIKKGLEKLKDSNILLEMKQFCDDASEDFKKFVSLSTFVFKSAEWRISDKIDDFLSFEPYVYLENEVLKHHEMRIKAKWLRYTMEAFSSLYPNDFADEIETIKGFQDVLGEMHDYDVWIENIPKFQTDHAKAENLNKQESDSQAQQLSRFLEYVKELRKSSYQSFVDSWEKCQKTNFFSQLRQTIAQTNSEGKQAGLQEITDEKVAVLSDVHGNLQAVQAIFEDAEKIGISQFLNAGDFIGFGANPNEVIEFLQSKNVFSVMGNFDLEVIEKAKGESKEKKIAVQFADNQVTNTCKGYLSTLPKVLRLKIAGKSVLVTHGSPDSINEHLYSDTSEEKLKKIAEEAKADFIITGHSHEQYKRDINGVIFLNPGSVGRPSDGNPQTAYAIVKFNPFSVALKRLNYDVEAAADSMREKGLPESFSQMLLRGVPLEKVIEEDKKIEKNFSNNFDAIVKNCAETANHYLPDNEHSMHVSELAVLFCDKLQGTLKLSELDRHLLECSAILHDIGLSEGIKGHNKKSMQLILKDTNLLLSSDQRRIVASIARYHRKGFPKNKHVNLQSLSPKQVHKICVLAGILRVADSLDYTHMNVAKDLNLKIDSKKIIVTCLTVSESLLEEQVFTKKKDLLETVLKRKMELKCERQ